MGSPSLCQKHINAEDSDTCSSDNEFFESEKRSGVRLPYTLAEDKEILEFMLQGDNIYKSYSISIWKYLERQKNPPKRTYQSLKNRFLRNIKPLLFTKFRSLLDEASIAKIRRKFPELKLSKCAPITVLQPGRSNSVVRHCLSCRCLRASTSNQSELNESECSKHCNASALHCIRKDEQCGPCPTRTPEHVNHVNHVHQREHQNRPDGGGNKNAGCSESSRVATEKRNLSQAETGAGKDKLGGAQKPGEGEGPPGGRRRKGGIIANSNSQNGRDNCNDSTICEDRNERVGKSRKNLQAKGAVNGSDVNDSRASAANVTATAGNREIGVDPRDQPGSSAVTSKSAKRMPVRRTRSGGQKRTDRKKNLLVFKVKKYSFKGLDSLSPEDRETLDFLLKKLERMDASRAEGSVGGEVSHEMVGPLKQEAEASEERRMSSAGLSDPENDEEEEEEEEELSTSSTDCSFYADSGRTGIYRNCSRKHKLVIRPDEDTDTGPKMRGKGSSFSPKKPSPQQKSSLGPRSETGNASPRKKTRNNRVKNVTRKLRNI